MENQRNSGPNPLLSNTSRQFYSRRVLQRAHSNAHLEKILKMLNNQADKKSFSRTKTEHKEDAPGAMEVELTNMLKFAKIKLQNLIKKQVPQWRQLYDLFEKFKKSTSLEVLKMNEVNFLLKMQEIMKIGEKREEQSTQRLRGKGKLKQGKLSLQAIKLHKQNQILKQQLDNLEHKQRKMESTRNMQHIKTSSDQPCEFINRISEEEYAEMSRELEYLRQANIIFRDEKRVLQEKINQLKMSNQNLCEEVLKIRSDSNDYLEKFENWRNIMSMQNQEIISLKRDIADVKKQFFDLYRKYSNTIKRITKLNSSDNQKLNEINNKTVEIFTEQIESFQRIRGIFTIRGFYNTSGTKEPRQLLSIPYKKYLSDKDSLNNPEGIKKMGKEYFRYFKPSFFVFLEKYFEYQGVDKENFEQINLSVGMHFLTTLRGILDSKHNEYIMAKNICKQFSNLSSFTISWLCNYKIDHKTRKQQQINTDVCFQTIGSFYARLMSNQLNDNWQVITFREFLLDTLTVDQLVFYLKARFKLMRGDCLIGSGAFLEVCYVNYLDALLLIQQLVSDFDYRKKLEEYIKRSVQFQRKKQLIDAHFILRLLLEYYQYYKSKVFLTLSKTFINFTRDRNTSMPFESYLKIYDYNFFEMSLISKVEIYQKAFSLGRGVVNLQNIFTILNQDGYLCGEVEKMFAKNMIFQQAQQDIVCERRPTEIQELQNFYQEFGEKNLNKEVPKLGLQNVKMKTNILKISKNLSYQALFQRFQSIHNISMLTLKKLFHSKKIKQAQVLSMIPKHIKFYKKLIKYTLQKSEIHSILEQFRKKNAARAIMKFYRKKKGLFVKSYLLSTQNIEKTNKIEQIRKQFTSMIDNIKKKYNYSNIQQTIHQYDEID